MIKDGDWAQITNREELSQLCDQVLQNNQQVVSY